MANDDSKRRAMPSKNGGLGVGNTLRSASHGQNSERLAKHALALIAAFSVTHLNIEVIRMSDHLKGRAAGLFGTLRSVTSILGEACDTDQLWSSEIRATAGPDGPPDGRYEIHIAVKPPSQSLVPSGQNTGSA
jgi:hypothetical protein